jgi:tetratricopeptide (TPR) repeat protein
LRPVCGAELVGRETEKKDLQLYLSQESSFILISGERGIGKTSVLREIPNLVDDMEVIRYDAGTHSTFWEGIGAQLEKHVGTAQTRIMPAMKASVEQTPAGLVVLPKLTFEELAGVPLPDQPRLDTLSEALRKLRSSVCVSVEEAFELDANDQARLSHLVSMGDSLYVVLEVPTNLRDRIHNSILKCAKVVDVGRLRDDDALKIVRRGEFLKPVEQRQVVKLAEGNPYYLQSICHVLWDCWRQDRRSEIPRFIATLADEDFERRTDVVHSGIIETIPEPFRNFTKVAAIAPARFTEQMANLFCQCSKEIGAEAVNDLKTRGILVIEPPLLRLHHSRFREYLQRTQRLNEEEIAARYLKVAGPLAADESVVLLLFEQYGNKPLLARLCSIVTNPTALHLIACQLNTNGRNQEALAAFQRLADVSRQELSWRVAALGNMAMVLTTLGQPDKALATLHKMLMVCHAAHDTRSEAITLCNIGQIHTSKGELNEALRNYQQAIQVAQEAGFREVEGSVLCGIAIVLQLKGESDQALKYFQDALKLAREVRHRQGEAGILGNIASVYREKNDLAQALRHYKEALKMQREMGYREGEAQSLTGIGLVLALRKPESALAKFDEALAIHRAIGFRHGEATTLGNIGNVHFTTGDFDKAQRYYNDALRISRELGDYLSSANQLGNIGAAFGTQHKSAQAVGFFLDALAIYESKDVSRGRDKMLRNLSVALSELSEDDFLTACEQHGETRADAESLVDRLESAKG